MAKGEGAGTHQPGIRPGKGQGLRDVGALVEVLAARAESLGVRFFYETAAQSLLTSDEGRVVGLLARSAVDGGRFRFAGAVALACGGFQGNSEMMTRYVGPRAVHLRPICKGGYYNRGEGIFSSFETPTSIAKRARGWSLSSRSRKSEEIPDSPSMPERR